jgi:hypothetical protein
MDNERRGKTRVAIETELTLVVFDSTSHGILNGKDLIKLRKALIVDISIDGLRIKTSDLQESWAFYLQSGVIGLALKFKLDGVDEPINTFADVAWINTLPVWEKYSHILGLKFRDMKQEDKDKIATFINRRESSK